MKFLDCIKSEQNQVFASVTEAKTELSKLFPPEQINLTSHYANLNAPRYLFRGESGSWNSTISSMERIRTAIDPLTMGRNSEEVKSLFYEVHELALLAGDYIQQSKKWDEMTSAGFLQHYEMPSEFLDFTGSLKTALGFALWNVAQKSPLIVYLCVAETEILASDALLVDFAALMRSAPRPRLQNGFGVYGKHRDLKGAEAVEAYGLRWFAVHATFEDLAINALDPNLLDLASDEAAGFMKWILDLAVEDRGKLSTAIAKYLAERVAAVDPIKKDMGDGVSIHISHTEAGKPFNAEKQKQQNFDDWRISDE